MLYKFYIVDVFTDRPFAGNPLAVLPQAEGISANGMQRIAAEFGFVESAFVLPPANPSNSARVRIFTPRAEVDFAGHPTIGTACALVAGGHTADRELVFEEGVGPVAVKVSGDRGGLYATLKNTASLVSADKPSRIELASMLSVDLADVREGFYASVGLAFCFVQLESKEVVDAAVINPSAWADFAKRSWTSNVFFFSGDPLSGEPLYARMVAPAHDVAEDPATGSAVAALAAWFANEAGNEVAVDVLQGVKMGRRSEIAATAFVEDGGLLRAVEVGGPVQMRASGEIEVDDELLE